MRCSSCNSKNPKNRQIGSKLLFCNTVCQFDYISGKRERSVLIIKTSDRKTIELDKLGPFESSKTINNFLEDASDNEITLPITSNVIKNIMDPSILGLQDRIEITLAYNYLDMDQDLWLQSIRNVFSYFFRSDQEILTFLDFRVYYNLPSDGGFNEKQNISLYKNQELIINDRYSNGIKTKYPSILNFSNDQLIKFFNYASEFRGFNGYEWWNNFRCSHTRFYNIITEHMKRKEIQIHPFYKDKIILPAEIFIQWEIYFKKRGFKNIFLLFKNLNIQAEVTKENIKKLIRKCIVDLDYTLLYKITYDWKFKEIMSASYA